MPLSPPEEERLLKEFLGLMAIAAHAGEEGEQPGRMAEPMCLFDAVEPAGGGLGIKSSSFLRRGSRLTPLSVLGQYARKGTFCV